MIPWVKNQFFTLYKRNLSFFFLLLTQSDPIYSIASRCHHCGRSKHAPQSQTRNAPERTNHPRDSRNQEPDSPPTTHTRKRRARDASAGIEEQVGEVGGVPGSRRVTGFGGAHGGGSCAAHGNLAVAKPRKEGIFGGRRLQLLRPRPPLASGERKELKATGFFLFLYIL